MNGYGNLQVGDVVILNSGGPKMTVKELNSNGRVTCCWFSLNPSDGLMSQAFHHQTLQKII